MKLSQSGSTTTLVVITAIVVALIGIGVWQSGVFDEDSTIADPISVAEEMAADELQAEVDNSQTSMLVGPQIVEGSLEEATLEAVEGFTGSGIATNQITTEGDTIHGVVAQLEVPAEDKFYEGWIVGPSIISTGMLESEGGDEWSIVFTTNQDISEHDEVVVTLETLENGLDGVPEARVLEGSF